jgi:GTP-binding protein
MIIGENPRPEDIDVNITREKKLTNMRAASADTTERLVPPRLFSLEQALELLRDDGCLEVTPHAVRLRKVILPQQQRARARGRTAGVRADRSISP